ncbi:MAG TPA: GAF domain-containing SpoIIE family protein phosphatase [Micromonosporaceae bacterium]|nr:GAF domain-containing SpoIIE family protein phosphatase [Micromonosporaceae bacterium]
MITEPAAATDERLRDFDTLLQTTSSHRDLDQLLSDMLGLVQDLFKVEAASILLLDRPAQQLFAAATKGLEDEVIQGLRVPVGQGFSGRVAAERMPIVLNTVDSSTVSSRVLIRKGIKTLLGVPMIVDGDLVGVLHLGTTQRRRFSDDDVALLRAIAERAAVASRERLTRSERSAAIALQRSLLPARLPDLEDLEMAARYLPGNRMGVGGDWYDVFLLPSGQVGIVVGDVAGHGLSAAVVMGRLRSALRAYALEAEDPADALTRLDEKSRHFEAGSLTTVLYAVVDQFHEHVAISMAGHLPPVVARAGESGRLLDAPVDPPIGVPTTVGTQRKRRNTDVDIDEGTVLVFYTDGLVERRHQPIDEGLDRLCCATKAESADVCATIVDSLGIEEATDDIAILAIRRTGATSLDSN